MPAPVNSLWHLTEIAVIHFRQPNSTRWSSIPTTICNITENPNYENCIHRQSKFRRFCRTALAKPNFVCHENLTGRRQLRIT